MSSSVIRSTIEFGNRTSVSTQAARPFSPVTVSRHVASRSPANAVNTRLAMCPLPWMLSQDMVVNGGSPRARRRASASVISPNVVLGSAPGTRSAATAGFSASNSPVTWWKLYPPSVTVNETMRVTGSAIFSITACGSSGA